MAHLINFSLSRWKLEEDWRMFRGGLERLGEAWGVPGNASGRIGEAGAQHTMPEALFRHSMALHKR